jgi:hypothetical protein
MDDYPFVATVFVTKHHLVSAFYLAIKLREGCLYSSLKRSRFLSIIVNLALFSLIDLDLHYLQGFWKRKLSNSSLCCSNRQSSVVKSKVKIIKTLKVIKLHEHAWRSP